MTVLVTGASGFIGRHLTAYFDRIEQPYIAQTRTPSNFSDNWVVDLSNRITDFPDGVDLVIHLAARSPLPRSSITSYLNDNVTVTYNLVEACRNREVRKLIFSSAIDCYGDVSTEIVDENTTVGNLEKANGDFYAWSKIGCEWILSQDDLPFRTLLIRLPGVVGPGCGNPWLNRVADALLQNLPVKLYNLDTMFNNALHVEDLCQFIGSCLDLQWENSSELINLASGDPLSIRNTVEYLKEKLGSSSELVAIEPPRKSYLISIEKAKEKYGYVPTSIHSVLDRFSDDLCNKFPTESSYRKLP